MKKKLIVISHFLLVLLFFLSSCTDDRYQFVPYFYPEKEAPPTELKEGLTLSPAALEATKEAKITFKAAKSSALFGYTGDVYAHIGVTEGGADWMFVPAAWDENIDKCKMKKEADNTWSLTLSPSIREWFGATDGIAVHKIGLVIRSADGTLKGFDEDSFIEVKDEDVIAPGETVNESLPAGVVAGINIVNPTTVTFALYDKDLNGARRDYAYLVGDFNDWKLTNDYQMKRDEAAGCWWYTVSNLNPQTEYAFQYYLGSAAGGAIRLADAYTEKILDGSDADIPAATYPNLRKYPSDKTAGTLSTFQTEPQKYTWEVNDFEIAHPDNLVIYEMLLRDFTAEGNLAGAMKQLSYLKSLGVNAIELMPVQEFDGNDSWGYNPCFYFAMDKAYGTKEMYKQFIDACHRNGMAVLLDVVYNQATGAMPFAKLYWDSSKNKTAPNNPWFNVDAPHPYSVFHDWNHESPLVRAFVKRNLEFLLKEYRVDGFRFDLTKGFTQNKSSESSASNYDASRVAILKDYNATIKAVKPDAYVILEHFCAENEEKELAEDGMRLWRNANEAYCQAAMGNADKSSFASLTTIGTSMPFGGWVGFMESHDEERAAYKQTQWGIGTLKTDLGDRMKQLATNTAFFLTVSGPKMVWQFGEMGYDISIEENGRTGKKPVKWEYLDLNERKTLHDTYAKLAALRNAHPELFASSATMNWKVSTSNWANGRFITLTAGNKGVVVVGNFTEKETALSASFPFTGVWYNYMDAQKVLQVNAPTQEVKVPAHDFVLYTNFE